MACAVAGDPARRHFAPFGNKLRNYPEILVIDPQRLVGAESAHLAPEHRPAARRTFLVIRPLPTWSWPSVHLCHKIKLPLSSVYTVPHYSAVFFSGSAEFGLFLFRN
jgi:hypothetical protein